MVLKCIEVLLESTSRNYNGQMVFKPGYWQVYPDDPPGLAERILQASTSKNIFMLVNIDGLWLLLVVVSERRAVRILDPCLTEERQLKTLDGLGLFRDMSMTISHLQGVPQQPPPCHYTEGVYFSALFVLE
jgi:hypothetical protein